MSVVNVGGKPRQFDKRVCEIRFTSRQLAAIEEMAALTGRGKPTLVREAVELFLVAHGYLEPMSPIDTNEGAQQ
jgi:hypothetical protein